MFINVSSFGANSATAQFSSKNYVKNVAIAITHISHLLAVYKFLERDRYKNEVSNNMCTSVSNSYDLWDKRDNCNLVNDESM